MDPHHTPSHASIAVWVPAIQGILVIKFDANLEWLFWALGPLKNLLRPIHAHEAVHLASSAKLVLSCIPQLIMGFRLLKLAAGVNILSLVLGMLLQRQVRPSSCTFQLVVIAIVKAKIV